MKKTILVLIGFLALALGVVGIFLPLLPTTPFLLLAAFCFSRGSERFHAWLMNHPKLGPPVRDWQERRVIRTGPKATATLMLAGSGVFIYFHERIPWAGKAAFFVFALLVLVFLWTRRSR